VHRITILFSLLALILSLLLIGCAHPVTPQGGPKDEKPPKVLSSSPPGFTKFFNAKTIRIDFDEFVTLKNPSAEIFFSPPMKKEPEIRLRGKSVIIDLEDSLLQNTTYGITFGNAITDLTEGNILKGFNYVFSTGAFIDSLSLSGTVLSAFDLTPQKDVHVGIYLRNNDTIPFDSMPAKIAPFYITRTDENGRFVFHNLKPEDGRLFAIADQNSDLIFNQLTEKIAFTDTLVTPVYQGKAAKDTTLKQHDSTAKADSAREPVVRGANYTLSMFEQPDTIQRLVKSVYNTPFKIQLIFKLPVENLVIKPLYRDSLISWNQTEFSAKNDTVTLWLTRPGLDSITLAINARNKIPDTVSLSNEISAEKPKKGDKKEGTALQIISPATGYAFNQFRSAMEITWSYPVTEANFKKFIMIEDKDTLVPEIKYADSLRRKMVILHKWKEDKPYKLIIPGSSVTAITGTQKDTIFYSFRTRAEKDFGNLVIAVNLPEWDGNYLIQLLNEKENLLFEQKVSRGQESIRFEHLPPLKYKLKAVTDRNGNGKWDPGNFFGMKQPEEVKYFPKPLEIRANWDVEETWN
jgi:hypothetical protein